MRTVRSIAYQFAVELNLPHKFNTEEKLAGYDWLYSFMERNPNLSIRKAEGLSVARAQGMNRKDVKNYFDVLEKIIIEHDLTNKPQNIFNMDETGFSVNNEPGKVIGEKGAKVVQNITSCERGEHVTIVGACSAEGRFLPPVLIFKGVYKKDDWLEGLPPGSEIFMNPKKAYMTTELFTKWFTEIFLPRKAPGTNLLILDGHASHCSSPELLQSAKDDDVIMLIFPSHTTAALQPLDRCIYGPFKSVLKRDANRHLTLSKKKNLSRLDIGKIIGGAWNIIASVANGVSAFKSTGIYPFNALAIPDHFFSISDSSLVAMQQTDTTSSYHSLEHQPSTSKESIDLPVTPNRKGQITPSKILKKISPVPNIPSSKSKRKQQALILTSPDFIAGKSSKVDASRKEIGRSKNKKCKISKSDEADDMDLCAPLIKNKSYPKNDCEVEEEVESNCCAECWENYFTTTRKDDWIQCSACKKWVHENCSIYKMKCTDCGRKEVRENNVAKQK